MEKDVSTLKKLHAVAEEIYNTLEKEGDHATLLTLRGDLGAGKTAFTKELAGILGIEEHVTSPTFVLAKEYNLKDQKFEKLIHIDAYRLEKGEDLGPIGFEGLLRNSSNLVVLEWPERVENSLPEWRKEISIVEEGNARKLIYEN